MAASCDFLTQQTVELVWRAHTGCTRQQTVDWGVGARECSQEDNWAERPTVGQSGIAATNYRGGEH